MQFDIYKLVQTQYSIIFFFLNIKNTNRLRSPFLEPKEIKNIYKY